jgi:TRAP-type C4-dicarboxylate transport system substrate-binding protein
MRMQKNFGMRACAIAAAMMAATLAPAAAQTPQSPVLLRVADGYPVGHPVPNGTIKPFMEAVKKASNGAVDFQFFPSEQLSKQQDMLTSVLNGIADITITTPGYVTDKMPLSGVSEIPGGYQTSCQGTEAMWDLTHGGILDKDEFTPVGVVALIIYNFTPYQLFSTHPLTSITDLKGMRVRSSGALMDITIRTLGGVPMHITAAETHEALSRGTMDGALFAYESVFAYDLVPYLKSATDNERMAGTVVTYMMSRTKFATLSPDIQKMMLEQGRLASLNGCHAAEAYAKVAVDKMRAAGVSIYEAKPDEQKLLDSLNDKVADQWAEGMEKRGKPGRAVVEAFRAEVQKYQGQ